MTCLFCYTTKTKLHCFSKLYLIIINDNIYVHSKILILSDNLLHNINARTTYTIFYSCVRYKLCNNNILYGRYSRASFKNLFFTSIVSRFSFLFLIIIEIPSFSKIVNVNI